MGRQEWRVSWRWLDGRDPYPVRHKIFRTRAGADRFVEKLQSNGGTYEKWDDGTGIQTGELVVTKLRLDYASLETRNVEEWSNA